MVRNDKTWDVLESYTGIEPTEYAKDVIWKSENIAPGFSYKAFDESMLFWAEDDIDPTLFAEMLARFLENFERNESYHIEWSRGGEAGRIDVAPGWVSDAFCVDEMWVAAKGSRVVGPFLNREKADAAAERLGLQVCRLEGVADAIAGV